MDKTEKQDIMRQKEEIDKKTADQHSLVRQAKFFLKI